MQSAGAQALLDLLRSSVRRSAGNEPVAVLFSGGLDSSIVAALCAEVSDVTLYTVGTATATDIHAAVAGASRSFLRLVTVVTADEEVRAASLGVSELFREKLGTDPDILQRSIFSPMFHVMRFVKEKHVFTGQGADELFGGYHRYLDMDPELRERAMRHDALALLSGGTGRDVCIAEHYGKVLHMPFLSRGVVDFSFALPPSAKIEGQVRKKILRECAAMLSLHASSADKKAMQYGSGFSRVLSKSG